jgi:hypothetical protein
VEDEQLRGGQIVVAEGDEGGETEDLAAGLGIRHGGGEGGEASGAAFALVQLGEGFERGAQITGRDHARGHVRDQIDEGSQLFLGHLAVGGGHEEGGFEHGAEEGIALATRRAGPLEFTGGALDIGKLGEGMTREQLAGAEEMRRRAHTAHDATK